MWVELGAGGWKWVWVGESGCMWVDLGAGGWKWVRMSGSGLKWVWVRDWVCEDFLM